MISSVIATYLMIPSKIPAEPVGIIKFEDELAHVANANDPVKNQAYVRPTIDCGKILNQLLATIHNYLLNSFGIYLQIHRKF